MRDYKGQIIIKDVVRCGELQGTITKIETISLVTYAYLENCTYRGTYRDGCPAPSQYVELSEVTGIGRGG